MGFVSILKGSEGHVEFGNFTLTINKPVVFGANFLLMEYRLLTDLDVELETRTKNLMSGCGGGGHYLETFPKFYC